VRVDSADVIADSYAALAFVTAVLYAVSLPVSCFCNSASANAIS
jgi:hypothetical protein